MKKSIVCLLFFFMWISLSGETMKIGFYTLEPFMIDAGWGGKPSGSTVDYFEKYLAPNMGIEIEWLGPIPFVRIAAMLENKRIDAITMLTKTHERLEKFLYPATNLTYAVPCIIVLKGNPLNKITKADDLFGKKIGFIETAFIPPMLINEKISFDITKNFDYRKISLDKLIAGRFDGYLDLNYISVTYFMKVNGYSDKVKTLILPIEPVPLYCMFVNSDRGRRLIGLFDKANMPLIKQNVFETLTKKYLQ
jgi:ABC-type amino acid transport substrate-binding protein